MSLIDQILELLRNGEWHEIKEITGKTKLDESKVGLIMNFLAKYGFIELDTREKKTSLAPSLLSFLKKIQDIENEKAIKTLNADFQLASRAAKLR